MVVSLLFWTFQCVSIIHIGQSSIDDYYSLLEPGTQEVFDSSCGRHLLNSINV